MNIRKCFLLPACASLLAAGTVSTDFTGFALGDIQGQQGWGYPTNGFIGGTVVGLPGGSPAFLGTQGLLLSSLASGSGVANGVFSPRIDPGAGEPGAPGAPLPVFDGSIWYRTPDTIFAVGDPVVQLNPAFAPPGGGCCADRYARLALLGTSTGFDVYSSWPIDAAGTFNANQVFASLNPGTWYHFGYHIEFNAGVNPDGTPNDAVTFTVSDASGTSLGTLNAFTWESAWRAGIFGGGLGPRTVNAFDFLTFSGQANTPLGIVGSVQFAASAPEPSTVALFAAGAGALAFLRRRRSGALAWFR